MFHTASPFFLNVEDAQRDLLDPALKGTANVMGAAVKSKCTSVQMCWRLAALPPLLPASWMALCSGCGTCACDLIRMRSQSGISSGHQHVLPGPSIFRWRPVEMTYLVPRLAGTR